MNSKYARLALQDIWHAINDVQLAAFLAYEDIRQRYVRTLLGPLWIVLSTGIWFSAMAFVMANLFHQNMHDYMPFLVTGLLMWVLVSTCIAESSQILLMASPLINTFPIPIFTHYLRFIFRNGLIFLHNVIILALALIIFPPKLSAVTLLVIPGLLLVMLLLTAISVCLSLINLRYRDTHLAISSAMQILPFVTPIFWHREMLQQNKWIADANPFYHMLEVVRAPAMGSTPEPLSWIITGGLTVIMCSIAGYLFVRYRHRIIFWL